MNKEILQFVLICSTYLMSAVALWCVLRISNDIEEIKEKLKDIYNEF